ncbi:MAG: SGNH/GDSL hydrolase family protein [Candidatus Omnitrophica bacterium]|nr:SGNH/GDSL hydrolase family protein [Candidatus Omnitrophota bacterium]
MDTRYRLAPQMKEYDKASSVWLPYLMHFNAPNYSSSVFNTDSRGFRVSYKGSERIADFADTEKSPVCLLVGGSTVFGVGATDDGKTIASFLNSTTDYSWINFAGRTFSSTQELLLFLFYYQEIKNIKKIVIIGALNNLILYHLSREYPKELGSFFFWNRYNQKMNVETISTKRKVLKAFLQPILGNSIDYGNIPKKELLKTIIKGGKAASLTSASQEAITPIRNKEDVLYVLKRDILSWKLLTRALGIELYYVLNPLAAWIDKKISSEEKELFAEIDKNLQPHWEALRNSMGREQYRWFCGNMREICSSNTIRFLDMNEAISKIKPDGAWLFVDRAHLTDEGNRIVAEILTKEVIDK